MNSGSRGILLILSAPSGGGKSTLANRLRAEREDVEVSVSHTTRPIRGAEVHGEHYHFVNREDFQALVDAGAFAEHAVVYGNYYGTSRQVVDDILGRGNHVILDIDIQGGEQLMAAYPDAVSVFIVPPSMKVLEQRLSERSTENPETLQLRLSSAKAEIEASRNYQYVVINDELSDAVSRLKEILNAETARRSRMENALGALLQENPMEEKNGYEA